MKKLLFALLTLCVHTSVYALDQGDYGYGYRYHGYTSLEQQQETEHNVEAMQRIQALNELQQARQQMRNDAIDAEQYVNHYTYETNKGEE